MIRMLICGVQAGRIVLRSLPVMGLPCRHFAPRVNQTLALREKHLSIFNDVFARSRLDAAIFPQMREQLAAREARDIIHETTVSEINIAGLPGVTVPAGSYASGAPFNLIAIGPQWSEAELFGITFAYEQATRHRKAPTLSRS